MNQNKLLNYLLAAMIVWVPNQLHLPADLGVKGLNSINLLFLAILYFVHQRNKQLPPSDATPLKGVFIAYFCMLGWAFLAGQLSDPSMIMEDLTALKNSLFFLCLYFVFFHAVRDETTLRHMFYMVLFVAAVAGLEAIREGIDYGFGVYGETKRAAGPSAPTTRRPTWLPCSTRCSCRCLPPSRSTRKGAHWCAGEASAG